MRQPPTAPTGPSAVADDPLPPEPEVMVCHDLAASIADHLGDRLEAAAAAAPLDASRVRALVEEFKANLLRFKPLFQRTAEACEAAHLQTVWEMERRDAFDRLLVKRFAHLFPTRPGDDGSEGGPLSRALLPGFTTALDKMIGPMLHTQCQAKAETVCARHASTG